jgi:transposase
MHHWELLERATRGAVRFPRQVIALFTEAIHWRNGYVPGAWTDDQLDGHRESFDDRLLELVRRPRAVLE